MQTFDRIYIIDLHGNTKKKEVTPEGKPDKNVFDIQQGVAVIVGVKRAERAKKKKLSSIYHRDIWGSRDNKYETLEAATVDISEFSDVTPQDFPWNFQKSDEKLRGAYFSLPSIGDWFSPNGRPAPGIVTTHDEFAISENSEESLSKVEMLLKSADEQEARKLFRLCGQAQWNYKNAKASLGADDAWRQDLTKITYRPFDVRNTIYNSHVAVHRRHRVMGHYRRGENIGIIAGRQGQVVGQMQWNLAFCTKFISDFNLFYRGGGASFPLYLYPDEQDLDQSRRVNFDPKLYKRLQGLAKHPDHGTPDEVQVFDYIYGVLHCPDYRDTYAELLKIDFPRIPWPASPEEFWDISAKGETLRKLHLMDPATIGPTPYPFTGDGDNVVDKPRYEGGPETEKVWINKTQYFADAPEVSWGFYIGGYQPAQKWLKDRKGRELSFDDVKHYQRILKILSETDRIMQTITMDLASSAAVTEGD